MSETWMHGMAEDWDESSEGHRHIYETDPSLVPARAAARVIYELRRDVQRLNDEVMEGR